MARNFTAANTYFRNTTVVAPSSVGTFALWLNPNWNSGDSVTHPLVGFGSAGAGTADLPDFQKFSDNNIYAGFAGGGLGDQRIKIADTGLFTSGTWAHWALTWSAAAGQTLYKNAVSKGTHTLTFPTPGLGATAGNYDNSQTGTPSANAKIAEFVRWTVILTANELSALAAGENCFRIRPASIDFYWPLWGLASPEPDLSGNAKNGTVNGTVAAVSGPPITMYSPRWPQFWEISAVVAATARQRMLMGIGQ